MCCWHCNLIVFILCVARILRQVTTVVNVTQYFCNSFALFLKYFRNIFAPPDYCCFAMYLQYFWIIVAIFLLAYSARWLLLSVLCNIFAIFFQYFWNIIAFFCTTLKYFSLFIKYSCNIFAHILCHVTAVVNVRQYFCNIFARTPHHCNAIFAAGNR